MKNVLKCFPMILLFLMVIMPSAGAGTRSKEALRAEYSWVLHKYGGDAYVNEPSTEAPYSAGEPAEALLDAALSEANFIRSLAGLAPLELHEELNRLSQHGAVLMAANGTLSHSPEKPADMDGEFYETAAEAAASCNLILFNWSGEGLLNEAVRQFSMDDGEINRAVLGHRRWLLYPGMRYTGFGMAQDADGRTYAAMYVMDDSVECDYDLICWPSEGAFPAEYMKAETPWSVSPSPAVYDLMASEPRISMKEETTGAFFDFGGMICEPSDRDTASGQYFVLGGGRYGDGPAYIFRPGLEEYDSLMYGYQQNQVWTVRLEGMVYADGSAAPAVEYTVEMASLTPIDPAAVEIQPRALTLRAGESAFLSAQVVPDWADDLTVVWSTDNASVASVDETGRVTAEGAGTCGITAQAVNGRSDCITVTVEP